MKKVINNLTLLALAFCLGCGSILPKKEKEDDSDEDAPEMEDKETKGDKRLPNDPFYDSTLLNLSNILSRIGLGKDRKAGERGEGVKVAIFDPGYAGLEQSLGRRLPSDLAIQPYPKNKPADSVHGTKILELVHAVATGKVNYYADTRGVELLAFNTNGLTNFKAAIDQAIKLKVDIIVHAQIFEYGGNRNGLGFINKEVNRAIDDGILWVNAAGNYAVSTYNTKVELLPVKNTQGVKSGQVKLPHLGKYVRFRVKANKYAPVTPVKISLGWNDFKEDMEYRTAQDLGLVLESSDGREIAKQDYRQDGKTHEKNTDKEKGVVYTAHAREVLEQELEPGEYRLRVTSASENFTPESKLWLAVDGMDVEILEKSAEQNSVFIPADNPRVLSVGAGDVNYSSFVLQNKNYLSPDVQCVSKVIFDNGESYDGSSVAAAITGGALAAYFSKNGKLNKTQIVDLFKTSNALFAGGVIPTLSLFSLPGVPHVRF